MSAPVAAEVLRELGAEPRRFWTVRAALVWYVNARPHLQAVSIEPGPGPGSVDSKNCKQRTLSLIALCLVVHDPENDLDDAPHPDLRHYREKHWRRRLEVLLSWYVQNSAEKGEPLVMRGVQRLADELNMTPVEASNYCGFTEGVIRRRMRARGLLAVEG